jgi:hypothetical protein
MGACFVPNIPQAQKLFWMHAMKLQGNVGLMESQFSPFGYRVTISLFGDSGNVDARQVHVWRRMYHRLKNNFECT